MQVNQMFKLLLWIPIFFACNKAENSTEEGYYSAEADQTKAEAAVPAEEGAVSSSHEPSAVSFGDIQKMPLPEATVKNVSRLMKEGNMGCEVKDYPSDLAKIKAIIAKYQGYIGSENEVKEAYKIYNDLVIRVSGEHFEKMMEDISKVADNVDFRRISATDVSEEYFDLETRIKTKKEVEKRYVEFLTRAKNIEEVLKVENELRVIREEIEVREGRLKFLQDRVAYSTLNLNVYQNLDYTGSITKKPGFFNKIGEGLVAGWRGILNIFVALVYLWPVWVLLAAGLVWYIRRRRKNRQQP